MRALHILCFLLVISVEATDHHDFIILGAGTAGCPAAASLSAIPTQEVLVIDHGGDERDSPYTGTAFFGLAIPFVGKGQGQLVYNVWTDGAASYNPVIVQAAGGGSSINGGLWQVATIADLASWNQSIWTFANTTAYRKSMETYLNGGNPAIHGYSGPIIVNVFPLDDIMALINVSMISVFGVPFNNDSNSGVGEGVSSFARNVAVVNALGTNVPPGTPGGIPIRQSSWAKFLAPVLGRPNLKVALGAVLNGVVLKSNGKHDVYYTVGIKQHKATVRKELIFSLGSFNTPKFLNLAGVGDCNYLISKGIPCFYNNTAVGARYLESVLASLAYVGPTPSTIVNGTLLTVQYAANTNTGVNMEATVTNFPSGSPGTTTYLWAMSHRASSGVGNVLIKDNNPASLPLIGLQFYATNSSEIYDYVAMFRKIRSVMSGLGIFLEVVPGTTLIPGSVLAPVPVNATDDEIASYLLQFAGNEYHGVATCAINKVVDARLKLIGVPNVRIFDNSIVPNRLHSHSTCSTAMLIGTVGAALVKEDWGLA